MATLDIAREYALRARVSVLPIATDGTKGPATQYLPFDADGKRTWKPFQCRIPDETQLRQLFGNGVGIGIIGGKVSGNLEFIDFDQAGLYEQFAEQVEAIEPGLLVRLPKVRTPRPGVHVALRCETIEGNQKLAQEWDAAEGKPKTLIETRGEGGYVVAPGSPLRCHETRRPYELLPGPTLAKIPTITSAERATLLAVARSFNKWVDEADVTDGWKSSTKGRRGDSPGDDFAARVSWPEILAPSGWSQTGTRGDVTYWRRPGKSRGISATTGIKSQAGADLLCVFSSNAHPLTVPAGRTCGSFSKFAAFALLNHGGDFSAAAKNLAAKGYGKQKARATGTNREPATDQRPRILITPNEHDVNDAALLALASDTGIFQRGGVLVHVVNDAGCDDGIDRRGRLPRIAQLPEMALRERLTRCARFRQVRKTEDGFSEVDAHPPMWCYKAILQRGTWASVPRLVGVVPSPVLRPDGSVLRAPGYDARTGLYCAFGDTLDLPERPTKVDAGAAAQRLLDVVCDFPFSKPAHRAAWLACVLTPLARFAFAGPAPLFLSDANVRGSGKTLLAELVSLIVYGRDIARMANPRDDDEARKRITALALAGDPIVLIDNVVGRLGCASLDAALTATVWKDRLLGFNSIVELPLSVTWLASGNNVMLAADTSRRVLHIRLESDQERPEERTGFKYADVRQYVRQHRPSLLGAALTILSAYCQAGRPQQGLTPWGSFEGWSEVVREAVVWAGMPDPGTTRQELAETADREVGSLRDLLDTWIQIDPHGYGVTAAEIADRLRASPDGCREFRAALLELCPPKRGDLPDSRQIGNQFAHVRRRVIGGKALDFRERRGRRRAWFVIETEHPAVASGDSGDSGDTV